MRSWGLAVAVAEVEDAGIDTWSIAWYLKPESSAEKAMEALATVPAPRSKLIEQPVAGHRVGWFPGARLVFAEGKPGGDEGLCRTDALPEVADGLQEAISDLGVKLPSYPLRSLVGPVPGGIMRPETGDSGFAGVRRFDATVNLRFDDASEGLAALAGVAALPLPRVKTEVRREVGGRRIETVYLRGSGGKTVLGRWYDKGVESGSAPRGFLIRPEDQRRFAKDARLPVDVVAEGSFVRDSFVKRFQPLWRAAKGVKVGALSELAVRVSELVEDGDMTPGEAKAALGHLVLDSGGQRLQSRATWYRDRAIARRHGLVLADGVDDRVEVDLGDIIEEALESSAWGRG